jgi:hypothetical protein
MYPHLHSKGLWGAETGTSINRSILNEEERIQLKEKINSLILEPSYDAIQSEDKMIAQLKGILATAKMIIPENYLARIDPDFARYVIKIANRQLIDQLMALPMGEDGAEKVINIWNTTYCPFSTGYGTGDRTQYLLIDSIHEILSHFVTCDKKMLTDMLSEYLDLTAPFARALELQHEAPCQLRFLEWIRGPQIDVLARLKPHLNQSPKAVME